MSPKGSRTVWSGGKDEDNIKVLPIAIKGVKNMIVLSVDSSSLVTTVALLKDEFILGEYTLNFKREHSVILMEKIEMLLKDCQVDISEVDGFVVSKGPGSFTGLRIGMATIKGLSMGSNKPYVSISSLDALANSVILHQN